jgi:cytidylate kinase
MPADVIAFSVQTGSGGYSIAHHVADRLSMRYYDWEITSEAAARAGVTPNDVIAAERVPGFMERMMRRLGAISTMTIEGSPGFADPSPAVWNTAIQGLTSEDYRQFIEKVVEELADRGSAVIVGHAAQRVLQDHSGVLRVLVHGSHGKRAERLAVEQAVDLTKAEVMVKQSDKDRRELLKRVYHFDWLDASFYDVTLNTDHLSDDFAADAIVAAAKAYP